MQTGSINTTLLSAPRDGMGRSERLPASNPEAQRQQPPPRTVRQYTAGQAKVVDSLRRFASLGSQTETKDGQPALPLRSQLAIEAYVGTRREEEKAFLHEVMGVDTYA